jgi:hypothetical protein
MRADNPEFLIRAYGVAAADRQGLAQALADRLGVSPTDHLPPGVIAAAMIGAATTAYLQWLHEPPKRSLVQLTSEALDMVEQGLRPTRREAHLRRSVPARRRQGSRQAAK